MCACVNRIVGVMCVCAFMVTDEVMCVYNCLFHSGGNICVRVSTATHGVISTCICPNHTDHDHPHLLLVSVDSVPEHKANAR